MRTRLNIKRRKECLDIPENYIEKTPEMQDRRELTFLIQESALSEKIPLFHILDLSLPTVKVDFRPILAGAQALIYLGIPVYEPLMFMEQTIFGITKNKETSMAQAKVESYLRDFCDRLEQAGYNAEPVLPYTLPDQEHSGILALTGAGFVGKNQRFITEEYGCRVCIGYVVTSAPLLVGDYRYPEFRRNICGDCNACIKACPAQAISEDGYDDKACRSYRAQEENQIKIGRYSVQKCVACMACCPVGKKAVWSTDITLPDSP